MNLKEGWVAARRLFLLRLLVEVGGSANESVLRTAARAGGFARSSADDIRTDLDHLHALGCITEEWHGRLRVVTLTERGEDAAWGRVAVEGVEHAVWRRG